MIQVIGYITGRRCVGKNLTFADVHVDEINDATTNTDDHDTSNNAPADESTSSPTTPPTTVTTATTTTTTTTTPPTTVETPQKELIGTVMEVIFKRDSLAWKKYNNNNIEDTFPSTKTKLPHGGKIMLNLATMDEEGRHFNNPEDDNHDLYDVCSWKLLENPRDKALEAATRKSKDGGGIDCPIYLKERYEAYSRFNNSNSHKVLLKTSSSAANNKKDDIVVVDQTSPTTTGENDTTNSSSSPPPAPTPPQSNNNNNNNGEGSFSHGNATAKSKRAKIFASWLIQEMGIDNLKKGIGVLDIAGGKGNLSIALSMQGKIPCTIIDPLVRKHGKKLNPYTAKRLRKTNSPHPNLICKPFNQSSFLLSSQEKEEDEGDDDDDQEENKKNGDSSDNDIGIGIGGGGGGEQTIMECSICVGLHPDEATEDILDVALKYNKHVAIVPCCVFSGFFPLRYLPCGKPVRTYEEFIQYLLNKDQRLQIHTLPFEGRNQVIYLFVV